MRRLIVMFLGVSALYVCTAEPLSSAEADGQSNTSLKAVALRRVKRTQRVLQAERPTGLPWAMGYGLGDPLSMFWNSVKYCICLLGNENV